MESKIIKVLIAKIPVEIQIDQCFENIYNLVCKFDKYHGQAKLKIKILKSVERSVDLSKDFKQISILGSDIDDLTNPFNLIGIMQAIFRFIGIHSIEKNIFLLHGSSSVINKHALCFGDGGKNIAKTISSIECALVSKQYIGDEFCFLDMNNKKIFSYPFIPIHFRPQVKKHFTQIHKFSLPNTKYQEHKAGYFIEPKKLFKIIKSKKLFAFIFPHFHNKPVKIESLNSKQKEKAISVCVSAHILKLIYPYLDRMQFTTKTDSMKLKINNVEKLREKLIKRLSLQNSIKQIAQNFSCYDVFIKKPCDITQIRL